MSSRPSRLILMVLLSLTGCYGASPDGGKLPQSVVDESPPMVVVSISPLAWIVSELAGDAVELIALMPEGADPGIWSPDSMEIDQLMAADLIILNGASLEAWAQRLSLPIVRTIEVARACRDQWLRYPDVVTHSHGPEGGTSYEGVAGHTWLDPQLLQRQAQVIRDRLIQLLPDQRGTIESRWNGLVAKLTSLDEKMAQLAASQPDLVLIGTGPFWIYPVHRMKWTLHRFDIDPQTEWNEGLSADLARLLGSADTAPAGVIFWDQPPAAGLREGIEKQSGPVSIVWPTAVSLGENYARYLDLQFEAVDRLQSAISGAAGPP